MEVCEGLTGGSSVFRHGRFLNLGSVTSQETIYSSKG